VQVSRADIPDKTGAPEGALHTATIKHRQRRLTDDAYAHCLEYFGLLNPITEVSATEQPQSPIPKRTSRRILTQL